MTHVTKNNSSGGYRPGDSWLDDLFLEVTCQKAGLTVDELRKKRIISKVMHSPDANPQPSSMVRREPAQTAAVVNSHAVKIAIAAVVMLSLFGALYAWRTQVESPAPSDRQLAIEQRAPKTVAPPRVPSPPNTSSPLPASRNVSVVNLSAGIELAIGSNARYAVEPAQKDRINVSLRSGTLWISKAPRHKSVALIVDTPHGSVKVTGTALTVFADADVSVVKVFDGEVHVVDTAHITHVLRAGNMLTASEQMTKTELNPHLKTERKQFDEFGLQVTHRRNDAKQERSTARQATGAPLKMAKQQDTTQAAASSSSLTLDDLYANIQMQRKAENWQAAVDGYHQLISRYGNSAKSHAAKVAVANLYLEKLNRPGQALQWYDSYLAGTSKTLIPEALLGKANALRALAMPDLETQVLELIVQKFPDSLYGVQAKQRLLKRQN